MESLAVTEINEGIGYLRLNRPEKLNALSKEMVASVLSALDHLESDETVKVILLSGEGKAFCAGGDIASMQQLESAAETANWINYVSGLSRKLIEMDKYVVAAVHGYAAGAGFSLALAADFIVAGRDAKFALSFSNIGLIPDLGLIKQLAERVSKPIAKEWISSGKVIPAETAFKHGIINRIVSDNVTAEAAEFAKFVVEGPALSNKYVKYLINHVNELHHETAFMQENMIQALLLQTKDHREGVAAFLEKRKPEFTGK
ncbi:enoyl-CoA hydratase/isomerase family protein [Indiicoccus explosivorum]|uniref:enoyl-CoA hydratase/isomerase family protein n=1 Tax=Indiicoccus explosivorum TaxID=1917864 RepID=UPI000B452410|nr:enoyl-CoA hydratase/isomerase family protein [Indiicoccus explosivorum]